MESKISLALATKLKDIFGKEEDQFFSFPLGLSFTYDNLNFMENDLSVSGLTAQQQLEYKAQFARILNSSIKDDSLWSPDASLMLWDVLKDILVKSIFARGFLKEGEKKLLDEAIDFLIDIETKEGIEVKVRSQALQKYYDYKDIYNDAYENYLNEKSIVENATGAEGEELEQVWAQYREKALLDIIKKAENDWKNLGFKGQVEYYQAIKNTLEIKQFSDSYKQAYLDELDISEVTDISGNGIPIRLTFFSPTDAFDKRKPWKKITLTKSEIEALSQQATADLRQLFSMGEVSGDDIESVTLECNQVFITRPWFKPEIFFSTQWKLPDGAVVSDGGIPRSGMIPAYVSSMLVVRNIQVTRKKTPAPKEVVIPLIGKVAVQILRKELSTGHPSPTVVPPPAVVVSQPHEPRPVIRDHRSSAGRSTFSSLTSASITPDAGRSSDAPRRLALLQRRIYAEAKFKTTTRAPPVVRFPRPMPLPLPTPTPTSELVTDDYTFEGVIVLAFVCRRVPKCPNPDNSLEWIE